MNLICTRATQIVSSRLPDVVALYLYGSYAEGRQRPDSDLDLAILCRKPIDTTSLYETRMALAQELEMDVDCVDLQNIPLTLAAQVLESGILILDQDLSYRGKIETALMSRYANLNEERKEIIHDICTRGSVYER